MNNEQKAVLYQNLVNEGSVLENRKSKLKSHNVFDMSEDVKKELTELQSKINIITQKLTTLVNNG